jgi:hypothetical protein
MKRCCACGEDKPADQYSRDASRGDGLQPRCRQCARDRQRSYYQVNREQKLAGDRRWRQANPAKVRASQRRRRQANREQVAASERRRSARVKAEVLAHYGESCACCGTTDDLTIDHVNGGGSDHREALFGRRHRGGGRFYAWLIAQGYPPGYQTLCRACNRNKAEGPACRLAH